MKYVCLWVVLAAAEACAATGLEHFVAPDYLLAAWQAGKQGMVQAQVMVGPSGIVTVKIEPADPLFAQPFSDTLKTWKFAPSAPPRESMPSRYGFD